MSSELESYFEEETFETDVIVLGDEKAYECKPVTRDTYQGAARFGALINDKGELITWEHSPALYWKVDRKSDGSASEDPFKLNCTCRMVLSRASENAPSYLKGDCFLIRQSKGEVAENSILTNACERYLKKPAEFESPLGTFVHNPWINKFVMQTDGPLDNYWLGPCINILDCDKDNPDSCSVAHDYALQFYARYTDWYIRLVRSAVKNMLKDKVHWLLTDEEFMAKYEAGEDLWMRYTYASRVADKSCFEDIKFDNEGSFTTKMCCYANDLEEYFNMSGSIKSNRVKKYLGWSLF